MDLMKFGNNIGARGAQQNKLKRNKKEIFATRDGDEN
jgi:hypothetical protein